MSSIDDSFEYPIWVDVLNYDLQMGDNANLLAAIKQYPESIEKFALVVHAAQGNNVAALRILMDAGFSIKPVHYGDFWRSPICAAAGEQAFDALEFLVASGADINDTANGDTWPPLVHALLSIGDKNKYRLVRRIVELGADVNAVFYYRPLNKKFTPLSFLRDFFRPTKIRQKLMDYLESCGAKPYEPASVAKYRDSIPESQRALGKLTFLRRKPGSLGVLTFLGREYRFRWIPSGEFVMGSPKEEAQRERDERQRSVTIARGFWILETPVTQGAYREIMDENPSMNQDRALEGNDPSKYDYPVESVSWYDAKSFCYELNALTQGARMYFRLPTEEEWEYACRAGSTSVFSFGDSHNGELGNIDGSCPYGTDVKGPNVGSTTPVYKYPPNAWGLYDMHGNVGTWCEDVYRRSGSRSFTPPQVDVDYRTAEKLDTRTERSVRGGGFDSDGRGARSALRGSTAACDSLDSIGMRVVAVRRE